MQKQIVFTEEEYEEIVMKLKEYDELKKLQMEHDNLKEEYDNFIKIVKGIFSRSDGKLSYYKTTKYHPNHLHINDETLALLFNYFYRDEFYQQTGLEVDRYWTFK
ncbi:chromosome segregation protein [Lysinibacillus sp. NPDC097214]|uniref:chromosome segregation protein n=1 Tax=Lysinibacillus sp. NPDC097214 TaxID=3390584 RepID=UPI003D027201